jgi:hypothetical protein
LFHVNFHFFLVFFTMFPPEIPSFSAKVPIFLWLTHHLRVSFLGEPLSLQGSASPKARPAPSPGPQNTSAALLRAMAVRSPSEYLNIIYSTTFIIIINYIYSDIVIYLLCYVQFLYLYRYLYIYIDRYVKIRMDIV